MLYNHKVYLVGIYLRISKDDGDNEESESIRNQRKIIYEYLKNKNELVVYKEYVDDGYSGANFDRPAFKELLSDIEDKKVNFVITKNLARFGRNYIEAGEYLEKIFPDKQVRFYAILDNYDNFLENVENDFFPLKSVFNEKHCKDTSVSVKKSKRKRMSEGLYACNTPPFGYTKDPNDNMHLIVNKETSKIVKKIFELKAAGKAIREIATYLNERKIKTPALYSDNKSFKNIKQIEIWKTNTICRILGNQVYLGKCIRGKTQNISYKSKKRINIQFNDLIITENTHEAIITEDLFNKVHNNSKYHNRQTKKEKNYLLKDLMYCSKCGNKMYIRSDRNTPVIYCEKHKQSNLICDNSSKIKYLWLENEVTNKVKQFASYYINNEMIDEFFIKSIESKIETYIYRKKIVENDIKKITQQIYNMYNDKLNEKNTDGYKNSYTNLCNKRTEKRNELEEIEKNIVEERKKIYNERNKGETILKIKDIINSSFTNESIKELVKKIEINKNSILVKYAFSNTYKENTVAELHSVIN